MIRDFQQIQGGQQIAELSASAGLPELVGDNGVFTIRLFC
jgi:hypothetical protein